MAAQSARWRSILSDRMPANGSFATHVRALGDADGPAPWAFADTPELAGLERWGTALAGANRRAGVAALVAAAQHGFPGVVEAGGAELDGCGFTGKDTDRIVDGAAVEVQLLRAARWVDDDSAANKAKVAEAFDQTRQLHVWEPDLRPAAAAYWWYHEVGQLASAAILNGDKGKTGGDTSYYQWPAPVCVGRGLVVAIRGLRLPRVRVPKLVDAAGSAIAARATATATR